MLLLFDIDGTLVWGANGEHQQALRAALVAVHHLDPEVAARPLAPAGRTDSEIARSVLLGAGISAERIDERADAVREQCCRAYARLCPRSLADAVLPGIPELLAWLSERDDAHLALLTGNYEAVARLKLARAGLGRYFPAGQGAFGSDAEDRAALPAIARRRAGARGVAYPRERTVVIGDTPRDIACARADGVRAVAVCTGPFSADELREADAVAEDAAGLRERLEELLGPDRSLGAGETAGR